MALDRRRMLLVAAGVGVAIGVVLVVRARRTVDDRPLDQPGPGRRREVVTSDGARLVVDEAGPEDGPTVVLAHCWGGDIDTWGPVAHRLLARGCRVVRWYERGHGPSTVGDEGFAIERFGTDLAEVLAAVDASDAVVAGHSLGGMTAQAFAIGHPDVVAERVRGLVLVSTASGGLGVPRLAPLASRALERGAFDRAMAGRHGHLLVRGTLGRGASPAAVRATRDHFVATPPATRAGIFAAMMAMDLREGRRTIAVPTTVVVGSRDTLTPPALSRGMAADIPGARLVTLPGRGHMLPLEDPDTVADLIGEHLPG